MPSAARNQTNKKKASIIPEPKQRGRDELYINAQGWQRMNKLCLEVDYQVAQKVLCGVQEIADYLRISVSFVYRYMDNLGLPAMQTPNRLYITTTSLLDQWILTIWALQREEKAARKPATALEVPEHLEKACPRVASRWDS